jgi:lipopolysaccharide/colanic/teichoic acid biosynthesis glycosyltransferase
LAKPGLTGLAQVNGNIHISWQQRWEYDARYVECLNLGLDLRIILKTIAVIIFGEQQFTRKPDV